MRTLLKNSIAILAGAAFFMGGVLAVQAAGSTATAQQPAAAQQPAGLQQTQQGVIQQANKLLDDAKCTKAYLCIDLLPTFIGYVLYLVAAGALTLAGYIFDAVLALSIDKTFIDKSFVNSVWIIVRDFSNMVFIFVLLYTGIMTMFGEGNWKRTVINVVVIALLLNFSLFFTKVVIDAGNILAVGVYSAMGSDSTTPHTNQAAVGGIREKDFSATIVDHLGPQTFLKSVEGAPTAFLAAAIFIIGAIVNILAAFAFFRVALVFIGRIIGFWFLMITSPFAFVSIAVPQMAGNFKSWLSNLLGLSFVAPVFLFFLYIIMQVLTSGNLFGTLTNPSTTGVSEFSFDALFIPVVMVLFIYFALDKSVSYAKGMAGKFGELGAKLGGTVMGLAGGAALGGAALVGRSTVGRAAQTLSERGFGQGLAASERRGLGGVATRAFGRALVGTTETARKGTLDIREVGIIQKGIKATGVDLGKAGAGAKGGFAGMEERQHKADLETAKRFKVGDNEAIKVAEKKAKEDHEHAKEGAKKAKESKEQAEKAQKDAQAAQEESASWKSYTEAKAAYETASRGGNVAKAAETRAVMEAAQKVHEASATGTAFKAAGEALERAKEAEKAAGEIADKAKGIAEEAGKMVKSEDSRRQGAFASHVTSNFRFVHSSKQAQRTAEKIRKGKSEEEKSQEDFEKKFKEFLKKEEKKKEGGGEKKEEKKAEEKH